MINNNFYQNQKQKQKKIQVILLPKLKKIFEKISQVQSYSQIEISSQKSIQKQLLLKYISQRLFDENQQIGDTLNTMSKYRVILRMIKKIKRNQSDEQSIFQSRQREVEINQNSGQLETNLVDQQIVQNNQTATLNQAVNVQASVMAQNLPEPVAITIQPINSLNMNAPYISPQFDLTLHKLNYELRNVYSQYKIEKKQNQIKQKKQLTLRSFFVTQSVPSNQDLEIHSSQTERIRSQKIKIVGKLSVTIVYDKQRGHLRAIHQEKSLCSSNIESQNLTDEFSKLVGLGQLRRKAVILKIYEQFKLI